METFVRVISEREPATETVCLEFRLREKARQRATLNSGEVIALMLPRGILLRGGDILESETGRRIGVVAADEAVSTVCCDDSVTLARIAYHLGNRHVRLQVGRGWVRYLKDHVLDGMVRGLGAAPASHEAPFEPEAGAYHGESHSHSHTHAHSHGDGHEHVHHH